MKIKNWIIEVLGGITKDTQELQRSNYEKWAVKYLTGKNGEVTPDCLLYIPFENDDILVIRSRMNVSSAKIKCLRIAPWCKDVVIEGLDVG